MTTLTIKEFAENPSSVIKRVEKGEKIEVTDGELSAILVPTEDYYFHIQTQHGDGA
jgi:antitoxin (DNA-binding transcriptional repressor) of toxin-antitoxin stability system